MPPPHAETARLELVLEVLRRGAPQVMIARGGSMRAAIGDGARIKLAPLHHPPQLGDVVAVSNARFALVIHRVVGVDARGAFLIKGDMCPSADGWFPRKDVIGLVIEVDGKPPLPAVRPTARWRRALSRLRRAATAIREP